MGRFLSFDSEKGYKRARGAPEVNNDEWQQHFRLVWSRLARYCKNKFGIEVPEYVPGQIAFYLKSDTDFDTAQFVPEFNQIRLFWGNLVSFADKKSIHVNDLITICICHEFVHYLSKNRFLISLNDKGIPGKPISLRHGYQLFVKVSGYGSNEIQDIHGLWLDEAVVVKLSNIFAHEVFNLEPRVLTYSEFFRLHEALASNVLYSWNSYKEDFTRQFNSERKERGSNTSPARYEALKKLLGWGDSVSLADVDAIFYQVLMDERHIADLAQLINFTFGHCVGEDEKAFKVLFNLSKSIDSRANKSQLMANPDWQRSWEIVTKPTRKKADSKLSAEFRFGDTSVWKSTRYESIMKQQLIEGKSIAVQEFLDYYYRELQSCPSSDESPEAVALELSKVFSQNPDPVLKRIQTCFDTGALHFFHPQIDQTLVSFKNQQRAITILEELIGHKSESSEQVTLIGSLKYRLKLTAVPQFLDTFYIEAFIGSNSHPDLNKVCFFYRFA